MNECSVACKNLGVKRGEFHFQRKKIKVGRRDGDVNSEKIDKGFPVSFQSSM